LKWLNILGHFSRYAGVGRKTTMGLGMVEFQAFNIDKIMTEETIDEANLPNWKA
jgi:hypothetical protein